MGTEQFFILLPLVSAFFVIGLGLIVFLNDYRSKVNILFMAFSLSCAIWMFGTYQIFRSVSDNSIIFWDKFVYLGVIFIPTIAYHFSLVLTNKKSGRKLLWLAYLGSIFFGFSLLSDYFVANLYRYSWGVHTQAQFLHHLFLVFFAVIALLFFRKIYRFYKISTDEIIKRQALYILVAFSVLIVSSISFLSAYGIGIHPFMFLFSLAFVVILSYAILKHHLLNIKVIATELFVGVLILLVLFNVFIPIIFQHRIARLILFVIVLVFSVLLIRGVLKMERMNEHLRKLLEMKSEFLDIVSHQLRTPVSVINGVVSMLREGDINLNDQKEYEEFVKSIYAKGRKLTQIIEDILSASQVDAEEFKIADGSKKATQMEEVIESVIVVFKEEADKKGLTLDFEKPEKKLPTIDVSPFYLEQAISNLVGNAITYTPKGFVKIKAREKNNQIIVDVSDSGIGIPKEDIPKLFDKFVRAGNANNVYTDGSGLGLFIVRKLIEAHNGSVSVKSEEGKGSVFTITLPVE